MSRKIAKKNNIAKIQKELSSSVQKRIDSFVKSGELDIPKGYSIGNAIKSAFLVLQETRDKDGNPALAVCSKSSIYNTLLKMCVMGLDPARDQIYFIVYGKKLTAQISTFGQQNIFHRITGGYVEAQVIYEGDEFSYEIEDGVITKITHNQSLKSIDKDKIIGAYAVVRVPKEDGDEIIHREIMTIQEIKDAWKQGQVYKEGKQSAHTKFAQEMAKKTVINRAIKRFVRTFPDTREGLIVKTMDETEQEAIEAQTEEKITNEENTLDIEEAVEEEIEEEIESSEESKESLFEELEEEEYEWEPEENYLK